jgi:hypothetical protein
MKIKYYHLPKGQTAAFSFTFSGITHPHSLHCFVAFISLSHSRQVLYLLDAASSEVCSMLGLNTSQGRVVPNFFLYSCHAFIFRLEDEIHLDRTSNLELLMSLILLGFLLLLD